MSAHITQVGGVSAETLPSRRRLLLIGLSLGYFMVLLDTSVVNVALPAIRSDIGGGLSGLQWVVNGYTLTFAALLLTMGALSDRFGGRRVFVIGTWAFLAASLLTVFSPNLGVLITMRALLGVAGAAVLPSSMAVIATTVTDPAQRARALGSWAAITGAALAAGPVLGGVLTDALGWRSIFAVNVPVALVSVLLARALAPETTRNTGRSVDLTGQISAVLALTGLTFGVIQSENLGWTSTPVLGALAAAVAAGAVFLLAERRPAGPRGPMLPLLLFRNVTFSVGILNGLLVNFGVSGLLFVMSLYFQQARGLSALLAGCAFLPLTLPTAFNPVYTGRLVARSGPRKPSVLGFTLLTCGAAVLAAGITGTGTVHDLLIGLGLLIFGFGVSFAIPALVTATVSATPKDQAGIGSGALNSARQTGAVVGVSVLGSVLHAAASPTDGSRAALIVATAALLLGLLLSVGFIGRTARSA
ncbi:MFS transporter [Nocardia sp. alder85J]|uniref:MFS transporter n=1 Tax=Nocardia sp. alder85J TaxID=2862949 RepID=UPI001CD7857D|nr:MFS transporter [Nocardia sp. alder85J]MCX4092902.1 MFS transporter [Nocardia sp. alder85J]